MRADEALSAPGAYRACARLLFNDVCGGARDGSAHLEAELKRPESAGLRDTVAALTRVKAKVDAASPTADELTWADAIGFSVPIIARREFRRLLQARYNGVIPVALNNEFAEAPLGCLDSAALGAGSAPPPGSSAADWKACFTGLGLTLTDLAVLGPAVIGEDEQQAEAALESDSELAPLIVYMRKAKLSPARVPYELAFAKAVGKLLRGHGAVFDERRYAYAIKAAPRLI